MECITNYFFNLCCVFFLGSVIMFQENFIDIFGIPCTAVAWEETYLAKYRRQSPLPLKRRAEDTRGLVYYVKYYTLYDIVKIYSFVKCLNLIIKYFHNKHNRSYVNIFNTFIINIIKVMLTRNVSSQRKWSADNCSVFEHITVIRDIDPKSIR